VSDAAPAAEYRIAAFGEDAGFLIPLRWSLNSDPEMTRRAPVLDRMNRNRVVRIVGWRRCLVCKAPFFSEDVRRNRLCGDPHAIQD